MIYTSILGTGSYLPEKILTNDELSTFVDTSDEWIFSRAGIKQRHMAAPDETSSSMALEASKKALEAANISADQIQLIIVATCTPDRIFPSTACLLQEKLGIKDVIAFDVSAACSGFIYALSVADQFIRNGSVTRALVIGSEVMSRVMNWKDRNTCVLFGDGAGAVVIGASNKPGIHSTHLHADGHLKDILFLPNDMAAPNLTVDTPYLHMQGKEVFKVAVNSLGQVAQEAVENNGATHADIDWLVPHQANIRIIEATAKKLNLPMSKVILTVANQGNSSAAS
ncbi:MAG: ketoacyl-ACP synthase III, partial [Proteobacteria bacterium]|nr:ketoacyl-ACP synthase III [Pseudomonadota bacterium]